MAKAVVRHTWSGRGNHYAGEPCALLPYWSLRVPYACPGSGLRHEPEVRTETLRIRVAAEPWWGESRVARLALTLVPLVETASGEHGACYASEDAWPRIGRVAIRENGVERRVAILRLRGCREYRTMVRGALVARGLTLGAV